MAAKIALWNGHYVASEIGESLRELGVEVLLFKDAAGLRSLAAERRDIDFALSVNFRDDMQEVCSDLDMVYAGWSYDSGSIGTGLKVNSGLLREKDFMFLFNSRDAERCARLHPNTWRLPAAAARSFEREPLESGHRRWYE